MSKAVKHGTYTQYARKGCRCEACVEYQRARVARNRAERLEAGNLSHGTRSAYDAGCRCTDCKARRSSAKKKEDTAKIMHNHITRDIKPYGQCDSCDRYHLGLDR